MNNKLNFCSMLLLHLIKNKHVMPQAANNPGYYSCTPKGKFYLEPRHNCILIMLVHLSYGNQMKYFLYVCS